MHLVGFTIEMIFRNPLKAAQTLHRFKNQMS